MQVDFLLRGEVMGASRYPAPMDCEPFLQLFDQLDDVTFFIKDVQGRYEVYCDGTARGVMAARGDSILDRTDYDIYPKAIADRIVAGDRRVMESAEPLTNAIEVLISPCQLVVGWYVINRFPIRSADRQVVGVMGTIQPFEARRKALISDTGLDRVIERIRAAPESAHRVEELADSIGISPRQLGRKFQQGLGISPREFIAICRVIKACELLSHTQRSMTDIALDCGYYDQSDLSKHFHRALGIAPSCYRRRYQARYRAKV
jgi:AraC-like DNA-binding protein